MANPLTPEQISQILEEFFKVVGTRHYIGARYVPIFGRKGEESIEWDNSAPYEPLTIVLYQGNSYTSRQYVPVGVEITNQEFWALTGNYNAQVEQYRQEVKAFDDRINTDGTVMLAFGDSFSDDSNEWPYLLAAKFGKTCKTYGIGGDVWPFTDGLTNAINDYSTDEKKRTIAFAVAYGGINNIIDSPMTDPTSIESFITRFNANFPNVPLYIAPMNQCSPLNTNFPKIYRNAFISANALEVALSHFSGNFILMKQSIFYNTGAIDLWKNDNLHPNEKGSITIANNMATVMQGGTISFPLQQLGDYDTEHITYSGDIWFDGESIHTPLIKTVNNKRIYFSSNGLRFPAYDNDGTVNNYSVDIPAYYYTSSNVLTLGNQPAEVEMDFKYPQLSIVVRNVAPTNSDVIHIPPATINLRNITNIA